MCTNPNQSSLVSRSAVLVSIHFLVDRIPSSRSNRAKKISREQKTSTLRAWSISPHCRLRTGALSNNALPSHLLIFQFTSPFFTFFYVIIRFIRCSFYPLIRTKSPSKGPPLSPVPTPISMAGNKSPPFYISDKSTLTKSFLFPVPCTLVLKKTQYQRITSLKNQERRIDRKQR